MSDVKPPSYEEAYRKLRENFITRLQESLAMVSGALARKDALTKEDFEKLQHLAHGLAGSGSVFGFPQVTEAGRKGDIFFEKLTKAGAASVSDQDKSELEKTLIALRDVCAAVKPEDEERKPAPPSVKALYAGTGETFHVLVIDDDPTVGDLLSIRLRQKNVRVTVMVDAKRALNEIHELAPDLILLDVDMPGMDGHEVLKRLKQDPDLVATPVLMLTAKAGQQHVVGALHSGAIDYILKPCDIEALATRVEKVLDATRYTVLLADNDHLILRLLDSKYRSMGFKVFHAEDGKKAWDQISKILPDLVVLDRMMPGMDGLAVLKNMREENMTKDIPVILLSARRTEADIALGMKMGAQDYVAKPFQPEDLLERSLELLQKDVI